MMGVGAGLTGAHQRTDTESAKVDASTDFSDPENAGLLACLGV